MREINNIFKHYINYKKKKKIVSVDPPNSLSVGVGVDVFKSFWIVWKFLTVKGKFARFQIFKVLYRVVNDS